MLAFDCPLICMEVNLIVGLTFTSIISWVVEAKLLSPVFWVIPKVTWELPSPFAFCWTWQLKVVVPGAIVQATKAALDAEKAKSDERAAALALKNSAMVEEEVTTEETAEESAEETPATDEVVEEVKAEEEKSEEA